MQRPLRLFFRAVYARAYPRLIGLAREPSWLIQDTLLPLLSVAAYVLVYRALRAPPQFEGFVILGGAMTAFWLNVLWSMGSQLYWERDAGNLELYILAPSSLLPILAGMAVGGMFVTTVRATVILLAGWLIFDVRYGHEETSWWLTAAVFVVTLLAMYNLGMAFASLFLMWGREAWHISNLLMEPIYLLSGVNFPVRSLGMAAAVVGAIIPMTLGMDALRQLLFPNANGLLSVGWELVLLACLAALFLYLAVKLLKTLERLARKEGRLTIRWQ